MGLNPVSATIRLAKMSLSKILKPCQFQGRWSITNSDVPCCVCVKEDSLSTQERFYYYYYYVSMFFIGQLNTPDRYCRYCMRGYCCGNQTARRYFRQDILCVHETGFFKSDPILSLLVNIMSAVQSSCSLEAANVRNSL